MLSPCSARLHFSPKSSDVQVLFFGGHKAFNGSTVFPYILVAVFIMKTCLFVVCVHVGVRGQLVRVRSLLHQAGN